MKTQLLTWLILCSFTTTSAAEDRTIIFGKEDVGKVPRNWTATQTGKGEGSVWKIVEDKTSPSKSGYVLAQTAEGPGPLFNICISDGTSYKNVDASVSFKATAGKKDQGGGIVWRYQDADNYYVARFNPLEDNFRVYEVVAGKRVQLATKEELIAPANAWHTLRITMKGDAIACFLNGKKYLEATDNVFTKAGKVGLWTKADAQTSFDQFNISNINE